MALFLEIVDGPLPSVRFAIRAGATIGRKLADIAIDDPKVSGTHAFIESRATGFYLVDAGSANGIRLNGQRASEIPLAPGARIQIGRTALHVVEAEPMGASPGSWVPAVQAFIERASIEIAGQIAGELPCPVAAFDPPIELTFTQGRQIGLVWTLGFGPREVGARSIDLPIEEPGAPDVCFELSPGAGGVALFRTRHASVVRLNGQEVESGEVADGDLIEFANTRLQRSK